MNPFIYGSPVSPDWFIGRRQESNTILNRLANPYDRGSSAVNGVRGIGKTSFLQFIMQAAKNPPWQLLPDKVHFIFLPCVNIPLTSNRLFDEANFWRYVLRALRRVLSDRLRLLAEEILNSENVADTFNLVTFFEEIGTADNLVVLLLDEFEYLIEHCDPANPRPLYTLRGLINQPTPRGLALITASNEKLMSLVGGTLEWTGSPFYNNFAFIELKPFSKSEVNELIDRYLKGTGVKFSEAHLLDVNDVILEGHPEKVQHACSLLFESELNPKS